MKHHRCLELTQLPFPAMMATIAMLGFAPLGAEAAVKNWNATDGNWNTGANWSPFGVPLGGDTVFIGNTAIAENSWVTLNVNANLAALTITDGMVLETANSQLVVNGGTLVSGQNLVRPFSYPSALKVDNGPAGTDCILDAVTLTEGGDLRLHQGAQIRIDGVFNIAAEGALTGHGTVNLESDAPVALLRNGGIGAAVEGLIINQNGTGVIDLDGGAQGDNPISIATSLINGTAQSWLTINGTELSDAMDDDISIGAKNVLTMNLSNGWEMGQSAEMTFFSNASFPGPAQVNGGHFTANNLFQFLGTGAHGQINAPLTLAPTVIAELGPEDRLECNGATTVQGGTYTLDLDANIDFDGATVMNGGSFSTFSSHFSDGVIDFNGQTTWNGDVVIDGAARQSGNATVSGPTTITAQTFDLDGSPGTTQWSIGNALTVSSIWTDTTFGNSFEGAITITGTFLGKLTVNILPPFDSWTMNGLLDIGGVAAIMITRVSGSHMIVTGDLEVTNGARIDADTTIADAATVTFNSASARLRLAGESVIESNATFIGAGTLENDTSGNMRFGQGANTAGAGLLNLGTLHLGGSPGLVFVDRFEQAASGTWAIELGGPVPGFEHDQLFVTDGPTQVGGSLAVDLIDLGGGVFLPGLGDEFLILTAPGGGVAGAFGPLAPTFAPTKVYFWTVVYESDGVTLRVANIIDCPADLNGDGIVNGADLAIVLGSWGPCPGCIADLTGSGIVDGSDIAIILGAWGSCL